MKALEKFRFSSKWVSYGDQIESDTERVAYYLTISQYAFGYIDSPNALQGDTLDYFNQNIRPALDKVREENGYGKA